MERQKTFLECIGDALSPHRPGRTIFLAWLLGTKPDDKWDLVGRIVLGSWYFSVWLGLSWLWLQK